MYRRALEIREKNSRSGETDLALAQILELNYVLLRETGRADQAEPLFARATEVRAKHIQDLSPTEPGGAHRIGPGIYPPSVVSKQEPEYSDLARLLKWQGTVTLSIVVTEEGAAESIRLIRGLGLGLDEQALFAVRNWRFRPGLQVRPPLTNAQPAKVFVTIQVNFQLL